MPIFEYVCRDCHHRFETLVSASRQPVCPACESRALDKQLSTFAVSTRSASGSSMPADGACGSCCSPDSPSCCPVN